MVEVIQTRDRYILLKECGALCCSRSSSKFTLTSGTSFLVTPIIPSIYATLYLLQALQILHRIINVWGKH